MEFPIPEGLVAEKKSLPKLWAIAKKVTMQLLRSESWSTTNRLDCNKKTINIIGFSRFSLSSSVYTISQRHSRKSQKNYFKRFKSPMIRNYYLVSCTEQF